MSDTGVLAATAFVAVTSLGLLIAALVAGRKSRLDRRLDTLLHGLGFRMRRSFDPDAVRAAMAGDKKRRGGRQRWILPMAVGRVIVHRGFRQAGVAARAAAMPIASSTAANRLPGSARPLPARSSAVP